MTAKTWIGGITVLLEEPEGGLRVEYKDQTAFRDSVFSLESVREFSGPHVNGIYSIQFEIDPNKPTDTQIEVAKACIYMIWAKFAS